MKKHCLILIIGIVFLGGCISQESEETTPTTLRATSSIKATTSTTSTTTSTTISTSTTVRATTSIATTSTVSATGLCDGKSDGDPCTMTRRKCGLVDGWQVCYPVDGVLGTCDRGICSI